MRTQVGNVLDQKETYDWALNGDPADEAAAVELVAEEPLEAEAVCAALLIMLVAAEIALARLGLDAPEPLEGATKAARGDEAAAETTDEAKLLELCWTGRVWM